MQPSQENLKFIWFDGELLPAWAQLLDLAARMCPLSEETRGWFSRFANSPGTADGRTILLQSEILLTSIRQQKAALLNQLERTRADHQAARIIAAWEYSLETMIQQARSKKTCSWKIEGMAESNDPDRGDGNITLRQV